MGGGVVMNEFYKELGFDIKALNKFESRKTRKKNALLESIKEGSGVLPEDVKLFNKYCKLRNYTNLSARKYEKSIEGYDRLIAVKIYEIECTIFYCEEVFNINLEKNEAVTIACKEFVEYYEQGNQKLSMLKDLFPVIVTAIKIVHQFKNSQIDDTKKILIKLNIDIPIKLKILYYVQKKYAKNQKKTALKNIIEELFSGIDNKNILNLIAGKALP